MCTVEWRRRRIRVGIFREGQTATSHSHELVMSHSSMRDPSHMNETCHVFVQGSGGGGFMSANFEKGGLLGLLDEEYE